MSGGSQQRVQVRLDPSEPGQQGRPCVRIDVLVGEVDECFHVGDQGKQVVAQGVHPLAQASGELFRGGFQGEIGLGRDQVHHGLGLRQIHLAVEERPLGELPRAGRPRPGGE